MNKKVFAFDDYAKHYHQNEKSDDDEEYYPDPFIKIKNSFVNEYAQMFGLSKAEAHREIIRRKIKGWLANE